MSGTTTIDINYLRSIPGILKICSLIASFVGLICILFGALTVRLQNFRGLFYISVALLGIICTAIVLVARIYQLWKYKFYHHDVVKYEMYLHGGLTAVYFIASAMALTLDVIAYSMAAFFGFLTAIFYACNFYLCYRRSRQRDAVTQT